MHSFLTTECAQETALCSDMRQLENVKLHHSDIHVSLVSVCTATDQLVKLSSASISNKLV